MNKIPVVAMLAAASVAAWSQTRLDLRTQTKNVDFSSSLSTKPVKVGTAIPATCSPGELFFKSDAPAGSNLLGCSATNTWSAMSSSSGGSSTLGPYYCPDTGAANAYVCSGVSQLSALATGQLILLKPTASNTGAATLNINALGAKAIRKNGSQAVTAGDLAASQVVSLVYDGTAFQLQAVTSSSGSSGSGGQGIGSCVPASGSGTAYTCAITGVTSYATNLVLVFRPDVTSTGAATINVNGLGARSLMRSGANGVVAGELTAGTPYLISYDGVTFRIQGEQLEPDGSGTVSIRRDSVPRTIGVAPGVFGALNGANAWMGSNDFSDGFIILPQRTAAALPAAASNPRKLFLVIDGATATDCATGGGSNVVMCRSNGSVYSPLTGGGGGGGTTGPSKYLQTYPASLLTANATGGPAIEPLYNVTVGTFAAGSGQAATWWMSIPMAWSGAAPSVRVFWSNGNSSSSKTYNWAVQTSCDATGGMTYNSAQQFTTNDTSTGFVPQVLAISALGVAGCTPGSEVRLKLAEGLPGFTSTSSHYVKGVEVVWPIN